MLNEQQKQIMAASFPFAGKVLPLNESQRQSIYAAVEAVLDQETKALRDALKRFVRDHHPQRLREDGDVYTCSKCQQAEEALGEVVQ